MPNYKFNIDTLYDKTQNGFLIIKHFLGACKNFDKAVESPKNHFFLRDEKSASATLIPPDKIGNKYWVIKDFGGKAYTPISLAMERLGLEYYPALKMLFELFQLTGNNSFFKAEISVKVLETDDEKPLDWFNIVIKDYQHLDIIGRWVTPEIASKHHFFEVDYYEKVFISNETKEKKHIKVTATDSYPMFCYMPDKTWCKTYAPFSQNPKDGEQKKNYKHSYLGAKPTRYVYNLNEILQSIPTTEIDNLTKSIAQITDIKLKNQFIEERESLKLETIIIASGGSDGLNVASLGYDVIWFNSESEQINFDEYNNLKKYVKNIYNLPDIDKAGKKYGYQVAEMFWNIKTIWLSQKKVGSGKDFRDWIKHYTGKTKETVQFHFTNLLNGALQMKFFEPVETQRKYIIKTSRLHYFLKIKGFSLYYPVKAYTETTNAQEYIFIYKKNNIIKQYFANDIRTFTADYLIERGQPTAVIDLVLNSEQFNEQKLLSLNVQILDFNNYTPTSQNYYFKNNFVEVSKDGIIYKPYTELQNTNIWENKIIKKNIFISTPYFRYYKENDQNRVEIIQKNSDFMNYLINGSRIFWRDEMEIPFGENILKKQKYHEENRFNLSSTTLTLEQRIVQEQHFLNKCYAIGYLMHRFKIESYAKLIYIMDDTPKDSDEDSNGRSGKSLMLNGLDTLVPNRYLINGKNKNITTNSHLLDGFTEENDYLRIEDIDQYLGIDFFYNWITGAIPVNPKTKKPYNVEFHKSGKIASTSNFGISKVNQSTIGRLFFVSFSDYYHVKTDKYKEERKVSSDFNNNDLFSHAWDDNQWNAHYNFLLQCLILYLQNMNNEFIAPQNNIYITNAQAMMGENFISWCESYFNNSIDDCEGTLDTFVFKSDAYKDYKEKEGKKTPNNFKKSLKEYCKINGWTLNPSEYCGSDGLIKKPYPILKFGKRQIEECFYIKTNTKINLQTPTLQEPVVITEPEIPF